MTLATRQPTLRTIGSDLGDLHDRTGKAAQRYGEPGERCHHPGCSNVLRSTNDRDRCDYHGVGGKKRHPRRRGLASEGGSVAPEPAPTPRRVTREEIEMAAAKRQETKDVEAKVRAFAFAAPEGVYFTSAQAAEYAGGALSTVKRMLCRMAENGELVSCSRKGYMLRESPCQTTAAAPPAAAPEPAPEQPADPPAPSPTPPEEPAGAGTANAMCEGISDMAGMLRPFAGQAMSTDWFAPQIGRVEPSEVDVLGYLEEMDEEARERVLCYAVSRWKPLDEKGAGQ